MKKWLTALSFSLLLAGVTIGEEIGGKFAFGFEQGIGMGGGTGQQLGRGVSFKLCLSNVVAVKGVLGFNYSQKAQEFRDPMDQNSVLYSETKDRIDLAFAAYGILVLRRFERVHLNGVTGILIAKRDNHFKDELALDPSQSFTKSGEAFDKLDFHLRLLMAPEIFIFPNFTLEYKYGFDVSIIKEPITVTGSNGSLSVDRKRLTIDVIGDLDLVNSASVHFYF